ncbi:hypothetical protein LCGC14_1049870, partial [marine sediment metagenome]
LLPMIISEPSSPITDSFILVNQLSDLNCIFRLVIHIRLIYASLSF